MAKWFSDVRIEMDLREKSVQPLQQFEDLCYEDQQLVHKLLPFTAHDIEILQNQHTVVGGGTDHLKDFRMRALLEKKSGSFYGQRVLDVGCLEGGYATAAVKYGAREAVGIEARQLSVQRCNLVKKLLKLDNLKFYKANVKDVKALDLGMFDVIICSGLLYHLDSPYVFLQEMYEMLDSNGLMMVDTHVALEDVSGHKCGPIVSKVFDSKDYQGRWSHEYASNASLDEIESFLWASYGNTRSFWPLKHSLKRMFNSVGFRIISEIERPPHHRLCQEKHENCRIGFILGIEK